MESAWSSSLMGRIEEMTWLDKVSDKVMEWIEPFLATDAGMQVKDILHGRWLGHALHPVMTDLPIGFWTGSLLLDMVGARKSAGVLSAAGSVSAVGTAVTGIADWSTTYGRERRLGMAHGLLNTLGLTLQLLSLGARLRFNRRQAFRLSVMGWTISSAAAYLGGELVYGHGQMVNHDAWMQGPQEWTAVIRADQVPEGGTAKATVEGRNVLLYKKSGRVHAMEDTCTHAGGPLSEGKIEGDVVTCPWHGSQFRLTDGAVLRSPACFPQLRLETRNRAGQVEVRGRQG
jgi:nitrite reductase/ring-hydroxylating ferredoxin subunit/uncharacterized membrane protein